MALFGKKEQDPNIVETYDVLYLGGIPQNPKKTYNINFVIAKDYFEISAKNNKKFVTTTIPFDAVKGFEVVSRTVSTAEALMGGLNTRQLDQDNNIHITFTNDEGVEIVVRLEMITGVTVMGQARKCNEMMDMLRANNILSKLQSTPETTSQAAGTSTDIQEAIAKVFELYQSGILTQEEYENKKADLLSRL